MTDPLEVSDVNLTAFLLLALSLSETLEACEVKFADSRSLVVRLVMNLLDKLSFERRIVGYLLVIVSTILAPVWIVLGRAYTVFLFWLFFNIVFCGRICIGLVLPLKILLYLLLIDFYWTNFCS